MKILFALAVALMAATLFAVPDAEARRFGSGMSLGKHYKSPTRSASPSRTQTAAPNRSQSTAGAAGRTSGASRWLGPLAGLAAGGLLASLFFGDAFEGLQVMDILLVAALAIGGVMLFRAMRRGGPAPAGAGAHGGPVTAGRRTEHDLMPPGMGAAEAPAVGGEEESPPWFDGAGFLEGAKTHFIRLQAGWDRADFRDIREYTTPQLFAELQRERRVLGSGSQYTEVVTLDAEIAGVRRDGDQAVASVLFSGLIREEETGTANPFREIWHVQHPWDSGEGDWHIAGIQQAGG
ncbi:MAG: TIM44-like domain-containing protein [Pseudomonadota bacterium]|nr:TIM44-like domain-containing protein [Pseudomonadota bacterium]